MRRTDVLAWIAILGLVVIGGCDEGGGSVWSPGTSDEPGHDSSSAQDTGDGDSEAPKSTSHEDTGSATEDSGGTKDTATSKDTATGKDTGSSKDTGTGKDTGSAKDTGEEDTGEECACPDASSVPKSCPLVRPCETKADCCVGVPAPYTCNVDYPFLFECVSGKCRTGECSSDTQCSNYFNEMKKTQPYVVTLGCETWTDPCTHESRGMCMTEYKRPCTKATDCCSSVTVGFTCDEDFPYLYDCVAGYCETRGCEADGECRTYFDELLSTSPGASYDCKAVPQSCYGGSTSTCEYTIPGAACSNASDCCQSPMPAGFVCNEDYPYLYECKAGHCAYRGCSSAGQCEAYFEQLGPAAGMVGDGCR